MGYLRQNESRSKLAIRLIIVVMIIDLFSLFSNVLEYQLLSSDFISPESADSNDRRQQVIAILHMVAIIISAVTFIQWFRRAYFNLGKRINPLNHAENWAALGWFVPFISLYRPYQIAEELFRNTEEYLIRNSSNFKETISHSKIGIWWTFWIISNIIGNIAFRISLNADTIDSLETANIFACLSDITSIPAGIFAILMIKEYSKMESLFYTTEVKAIEKETIE
ncbi:MAG: DUF4328 domain-containing protein [Flavobacterium sp.]